jgi:hypothetical protein
LALRVIVVLWAFAGLPALAQSFTFDTPKGWSLEWSPDKKNKSAAPNANFSSAPDQITASVSILQDKDVSVLSTEQLKEVILSMAEDSLPKSREGTADVKRFGPSRDGMFLRLTDKDPKASFKYLSFAIYRKGPELALGLMTSNDDDGIMLAKFLKLVESVRYVSPPTRASSVEKEVWGAIATDANQDDSDPYYGIGGGDSKTEAEQEAIGNCRDEGAKVCVVRVSYTHCGAYAVSASGQGGGTGTGSTRRAAEKQALSACKGKGCEVIASDCN